jgi:hypothetical protein
MAGELTKWTGGGLVKRSSSALQRSRAAREAAEAALRPQEPVIDRQMEKALAERERWNRELRQCLGLNDAPLRTMHEIYDLPRICAVRRLPYMSRYVLRGGRYEYAQDIRHKQGMNAVEYEGGYAVTFPLAEEVCAWCRAWGYAAIYCPKCKAWFCYGKVTGGQARCACGTEGRIGAGNVEEVGLVVRR